MKRFTRLSLVTALFALAAPAAFAGEDAADAKTPKKAMHRVDDDARPMRHFKEMDKNGDGALTRDEFTPKRGKRLDDADGNKDGKVTYQEFVARAEARRAEVEAEMAKKRDAHYKEMFDRMDANKDGSLTEADREADMKAAFDRADADKNGKLSQDEMMAMHKHRMREARERMRRGAEDMHEKAGEMREKAEEMKARAKEPS